MSEQNLFGRRRVLRWTACLWLLGGITLAVAPPFGLLLGESYAHLAGDQADIRGLAILFVIGEV